MHESIKSMRKSTMMQTWFSRILVGVFVSALIVVTYWQFEPDPLEVTRVEGDSSFSLCEDRKFTFRRVVSSEKDLEILVQERWLDLDGFMDVGDKPGMFVSSKPIFYPLGASKGEVMSFGKVVPDTLPYGNYKYVPVATYKVNFIKTITKELPSQDVTVGCSSIKDKELGRERK